MANRLKGKRLPDLLPWIVLALAWCMTQLMFWKWGAHYLNADTSSELVLSSLLNQEHAMASESWFYATDMHLFYTTLVYQLGLLLFPENWHLVRCFASAVLTLLTTAGFLYMAKGIRQDKSLTHGMVYAAAAQLIPFSGYVAFYYQYGLNYATHLLYAWLLIGMVLRLDGKSGRIRRLVLIAVLSLICGLPSLRMPMLCGVPLLLACLILFLPPLLRCEGKKEQLHALFTGREGWMLWGSLLSVALMTVGFAINRLVLADRFTCQDFAGAKLVTFSLENLWTNIGYWFAWFGYRNWQSITLMSLPGIAGAAAIALTLFACVSAVLLPMKRKELGLDTGELLIAVLSAAGMVFGLLMVTALDQGQATIVYYNVSYYMVAFMLFAFSGFMLLEHLPIRLPGAKHVLLLLLTGVFFLEGLNMADNILPKQETGLEKAAAWLVENDITRGYASFWNANSLTEASDGKVETWGMAYITEDGPDEWLQVKSHVTETPTGTMFFILNTEEHRAANPEVFTEDRLKWSGDGYFIYVFEDAAEIQRNFGNLVSGS